MAHCNTRLQRAYDESYLKCSTAVYYEGQGDEEEAMRCWKTALRQITEYKENGHLPSEPPQSETEKALADSLRLLELQCKERVDLLEALRLSRQDDALTGEASGSSAGRGWIGGGTIPAVTYTELSRPALPPRSSSGPSLGPGTGTSSGRPSIPDRLQSGEAPSGAERSPHRPPSSQAPRPRSPEKHTLRSTLRTGGKAGERPKAPQRLSKPAEGPSKAAAAAWNALGFGGKPARPEPPVPSVSQTSIATKDGPIDRKTWDSHSRRLLASPTEGRPSANFPRPSRRSADMPSRPSVLSVNAAASALSLASATTTNRHSEEVPPRQRTAPPQASVSSLPTPRQSHSDAPITESAAPRRSRHSSGVPKGSGSSGREPRRTRAPIELDTTGSTPEIAELGGTGKQAVSGGRGQGWGSTLHVSSRPISFERGEVKFSRRPSGDGADSTPEDPEEEDEYARADAEWKARKQAIVRSIPPGVDEGAAGQILNEILVRGDEVRWTDVAGLDVAKAALREAVVYPFLRPDLFMGLREPIRGILLFGPPGTGKTLLARAVATESKSTFFSISASSLTSKYLGESEKLVRALFALARILAPSIIFIDEIDSLLAHRSGSGEHEATRRIKSEFLIQWSDLQRAAAGREPTTPARKGDIGDASRVLVLGATNLPWAIDEAARRRFARRQYIPLPEGQTRETQLRTLLAQQTHSLSESDIQRLVALTEGFSGSDITSLAKDAAMGPLRSLGEALLHTATDEIRGIEFADFVASLQTIRPSVSQEGLREYEDWARQFGERGG